MYKIAGELLPGVFHVSARALAAQALSSKDTTPAQIISVFNNMEEKARLVKRNIAA
jgi:pyruvate/2-oxoacid:ferredoxin oxidoreductase alpha subunit